MFKVALVGHSEVGKTQLFRALTGCGEFAENDTKTPGVDYKSIPRTYNKKDINFHIWDISGSEESYQSLISVYLRNISLFIYCFNAADPDNFSIMSPNSDTKFKKDFESWEKRIQEQNNNQLPPIIFVGTHWDEETQGNTLTVNKRNKIMQQVATEIENLFSEKTDRPLVHYVSSRQDKEFGQPTINALWTTIEKQATEILDQNKYPTDFKILRNKLTDILKTYQAMVSKTKPYQQRFRFLGNAYNFSTTELSEIKKLKESFLTEIRSFIEKNSIKNVNTLQQMKTTIFYLQVEAEETPVENLDNPSKSQMTSFDFLNYHRSIFFPGYPNTSSVNEFLELFTEKTPGCFSCFKK